MILKITYIQYAAIILNLRFSEVFPLSISNSNNKGLNNDGGSMVTKAIQDYFPYESNLFVVETMDSDKEVFLPKLSVPVVVFSQDKVLWECSEKLMHSDGYILITSNVLNLEVQTVPLLKCFNQTTLKLKTKYILVIVSSFGRPNESEDYVSYFSKLWKAFGIINIAVFPVQDQMFNNGDVPTVFTYNLFLAKHQPSLRVIKNSSSSDIRDTMIARFVNLHGQPLRAVFVNNPIYEITEPKKKKPVGANVAILFKQTVESYFNVSFDVHEVLKDSTSTSLKKGTLGSGNEALSVVIRGEAEFAIQINFVIGVTWPKTVQHIQTGLTLEFVFIVPTPKEVESWRLFLYLFQWQVSVGLGFALLMLSVAAAFFAYVHSRLHGSSGTVASEVISICKAVCSVGIKRPPSTHSQRALMTASLLLGLIFVTIFCSQLFALTKSKPRFPSIRTLHDLQDSNLPIYSIARFFNIILEAFASTSLSKLRDNLKTDKIYENSNYLDPKLLNITDRAVLYTGGAIRTVSSLSKNRVYLQYFEVVREPLFENNLVFNMPIGSVYFEHFNKLSLRLIEGGFYRWWLKSYTNRMIQRISAMSANSMSEGIQGSYYQNDNSSKPLIYNDLEMAFYILFIGLTISTLCFIIELCSCSSFIFTL